MLLMAFTFAAALLMGFTLKEPPGGIRARTSYRETLLGGFRYFMRHPALRALTFDGVSIDVLSFLAICQPSRSQTVRSASSV